MYTPPYQTCIFNAFVLLASAAWRVGLSYGIAPHTDWNMQSSQHWGSHYDGLNRAYARAVWDRVRAGHPMPPPLPPPRTHQSPTGLSMPRKREMRRKQPPNLATNPSKFHSPGPCSACAAFRVGKQCQASEKRDHPRAAHGFVNVFGLSLCGARDL